MIHQNYTRLPGFELRLRDRLHVTYAELTRIYRPPLREVVIPWIWDRAYADARRLGFREIIQLTEDGRAYTVAVRAIT